eukprot:jgi/Astpho2/3198/Aster-x0567
MHSKYPLLEGREDMLRGLIEQRYDQLWERHKYRLSDGRSETHLQIACLVLATYHVLHPWIRNEEELLAVLRDHMGERTSPVLRWMNRLRGLRVDYGQSFGTELTQREGAAELRVTRCFMHDVFDTEDLPQLTRTACCSQDQIWFEGLASRGVHFSCSCQLDSDDGCCTFRVERKTEGT